MIGLLMAVSLIGTVILVGVCAPLVPAAPPAPPAAYSFEQAAGPNIHEDFTFVFPAVPDAFLQEGGREMQSDSLKDQARLWVVEKSVQILREHGKSDEEIRAVIMNGFRIDEETLNKLLSG